MFITNELDPGEMLAELLQGPRFNSLQTKEFAKLRHDKHLCPRFAEQIRWMLDVYQAHGNEVHDIQSMRDDGIDVLLSYQTREEEDRRVGLQIKSDDEFCKWEAKKYNLVKDLKAQYATAFSNGKLDSYYILLCVDAVRHQNRIRMVCSELKNFENVKIVEPRDLIYLYKMDQFEIWGTTTRILCKDDAIYQRAKQEISAYPQDSGYFLLSIVCFALEGGGRLSDETLFGIWEDWLEFSGQEETKADRVSEVVEELVFDGVLGDDEGQLFADVSQLPSALCALYFDFVARLSGPRRHMREQILCLLDWGYEASEQSADEC